MKEALMSDQPKICRGSWCMAFGFEPKMATLEQVAPVLAAFEYDGIELGGFFDHATVERFPDQASRKQLKGWLDSLGLEIAGIAPGPYGDLFRLDPKQSKHVDADWTGAEIRSCCRLATLLDVSLVEAAQNVVPVARTAHESVERLRNWASGRCLDADRPGIYTRNPNTGNVKPGRKVRRADPSNN